MQKTSRKSAHGAQGAGQVILAEVTADFELSAYA
jgi:hypothetical protein